MTHRQNSAAANVTKRAKYFFTYPEAATELGIGERQLQRISIQHKIQAVTFPRAGKIGGPNRVKRFTKPQIEQMRKLRCS